tara:strand:- start:580 stop:2043 length:1464 start_codon:yes stop_codon:yes gene_type:complete
MKKLLTIITLIIAGVGINAQTTMNIHQSNGSVLTLPLNTIDSITYTVANPGNLASLTTLPVGSVTDNSAISGGNISNDGGSTVTQHGVCWSTSPNPSTADNTAVGGSGTGNFTVSITGLNANTEYFVRAYAINSAGTAYGNELSFTTSNGSSVTVPSTYVFTDENGNNTVAFAGQTARMDMLSEMTNYLKTANTSGGSNQLDAATLLAMYDNSYTGWSDQNLVGIVKQLKNKTALGDEGIIAQFETWMTEAAAATPPTEEGYYHQAETGHEWVQLIEKGLMSACFANQMTMNYLAGIEEQDNSVAVDPAGGKFYTDMEHHWDEAYGYFTDAIDYPINGTDRFWGKYAFNTLEALLGSATTISEAFRTGRAFISAGITAEVPAQVEIIQNEVRRMVAGMAIRYLNRTKQSVADGDTQNMVNHNLSEAWAFIYGMMFCANSDLTPAQVMDLLNQIDSDFEGFSNSIQSINAVIDMIASASGLEAVADSL